jgi:integrase
MQAIELLDKILARHQHTRVNGRVASERTATAAKEALRAAFRLLYKLGYRLSDPTNISEKHIKALCDEWLTRNRKPKTIQGYLSHLRIYCGWIGKSGLVKDVYYYLPNVPKSELRAKTVAEESKSWVEHGIDVKQKVSEADALDWRFGLMLRAQIAFGLRRNEALQMKPWKVDRGDKFAAYETKGGRPRDIHIDTTEQRLVLDLIKSKIKGKNETLGWTERQERRSVGGGSARATLEYSEGRYSRLMAKLGITKEISACTGHGLRAQFAENSALLRGLIPPTLGGTGGQMAKEDIALVRLQVSEELGHSRVSVTGAYYGSFGRNNAPDTPDRAVKVITAAMDTIEVGPTAVIPADRIVDCMKLSNELIAARIYGADVRKLQVLWERHSLRHATDWLKPSDGCNLAALEVAARSVIGAKSPGSEPAAN